MKNLKSGLTLLFLLNFILVQGLMARPFQTHVVSIREVQEKVIARSTQRVDWIEEIYKLLRHSEVQRQVGETLDLQKIEVAIATLDDETLEDLAGRSQKVNNQVQAGVSSGVWIVVVVVVILVVVAVALGSGRST